MPSIGAVDAPQGELDEPQGQLKQCESSEQPRRLLFRVGRDNNPALISKVLEEVGYRNEASVSEEDAILEDKPECFWGSGCASPDANIVRFQWAQTHFAIDYKQLEGNDEEVCFANQCRNLKIVTKEGMLGEVRKLDGADW